MRNDVQREGKGSEDAMSLMYRANQPWAVVVVVREDEWLEGRGGAALRRATLDKVRSWLWLAGLHPVRRRADPGGRAPLGWGCWGGRGAAAGQGAAGLRLVCLSGGSRRRSSLERRWVITVSQGIAGAHRVRA